jgi:hypothetical protein
MVDRAHGRGSARSTSFIKPLPSALGSTAWIKSIEGLSACLTMAVGSGSDDRETPTEESGGVLGCNTLFLKGIEFYKFIYLNKYLFVAFHDDAYFSWCCEVFLYFIMRVQVIKIQICIELKLVFKL